MQPIDLLPGLGAVVGVGANTLTGAVDNVRVGRVARHAAQLVVGQVAIDVGPGRSVESPDAAVGGDVENVVGNRHRVDRGMRGVGKPGDVYPAVGKAGTGKNVVVARTLIRSANNKFRGSADRPVGARICVVPILEKEVCCRICRRVIKAGGGETCRGGNPLFGSGPSRAVVDALLHRQAVGSGKASEGIGVGEWRTKGIIVRIIDHSENDVVRPVRWW